METPGGRRGRTAIGRSLDVYYRDAARTRRMDDLNASFVRRGGLVFDIGAHVGDRTASFLRLGARVVALEPQPRVFRALRLIHGRAPGAILRCAAAGAQAGEIEMRVNSANPTVSTVSGDLVAAAASADGWQGEVWDRTIRVPVTTLDALIAEHGRPDFVKIDVEGNELEVLRGLSATVPALSFEFTTIQRDVAFGLHRPSGGAGAVRVQRQPRGGAPTSPRDLDRGVGDAGRDRGAAGCGEFGGRLRAAGVTGSRARNRRHLVAVTTNADILEEIGPSPNRASIAAAALSVNSSSIDGPRVSISLRRGVP